MGVDEVGADSFVGMLVPSTEGSTVGNTLGDDDDVDDGDEVVSNTDTERSEVIGNPDLVARLSMSDTKASVTITVASSGRTSRSSCPWQLLVYLQLLFQADRPHMNRCI